MRFRLMRLLRLYEQEQAQRQLEYHAALALCQEWAERVAGLESALAAAVPGHAQRGEELQRTWAYRQALLARLQKAQAELAAAEARAAASRELLLAARQQCKTVQALKEKHDARLLTEAARQEQRVLDEAGLRLYQAARTEPHLA